MSYRRTAIAGKTFDERLKGQGAQGRNDLAFSLALKKDNWKLIYDPKVAVNHYPGQQFEDNRRTEFNASRYANEAHNETLVLLEYLSPLGQFVYITWSILIGTRDRFGLVQCLRFLPSQKGLVLQKWWISIQSHWQGWRTSR